MNNYLIVATYDGYYTPYDAKCWVERCNENLSQHVYHDLNEAISAAQTESVKIPPRYEDFITLELIKFDYIPDPDNPDAAPIIDYENATEPIPDMVNGRVRRIPVIEISSKNDEVIYSHVMYAKAIAPDIKHEVADHYLSDEQDTWKHWPNPGDGKLTIRVYDRDTDEVILSGWYDANEIKLFVNVDY